MNMWFQRHGVDPRLYGAWVEMRRRCRAPRHRDNYAGRGITVCKRWQTFVLFAADMGPHPGRGWTLDRVNNNSGYRPGNCRWATYSQQRRNSRHSKLTAADVALIRSSPLSVSELARRFNCSHATISDVRTGRSWKTP